MNLHNHLWAREFNTLLHGYWIDECERCITFPLWNLSGQMVGYQRYRPEANKEKKNDPREGRYFTRVKDGRIGVWGLESWSLTPGHLFITEGVFDAARLTLRGYSAVALLSARPNASTVRWLRCQGRSITAVCDDDDAGRLMAALVDRAHFTPGGDLGDMTPYWVDRFLEGLDLPV